MAVVSACLLSPLPAVAQETRIAQQAVRCSAIFFVLAHGQAKEADIGRQFDHSAVMFSALYGKEQSEKTGPVPAADMLKRRDQVLQEFQDTFRDRQGSILEEAVLCGSWSDGFTMQGENVEYVPIIPKIIPQNVREKYAGYAAPAFQGWIK